MGASQSADQKGRQQRVMDKLYLDKEETGDVTFVVQSKNIRAHKCVLAALSPKFNEQFYGLQPGEGKIIVEDVKATEFEEFLRFFYLDKPKLSVANIEGVLHLAIQSLVDEFVDDCVNFVMANTTDALGIGFAYRLAHTYGLKEPEKSCLLFISKVTEEVFKSDAFLDDCNREMLFKILKMDSLSCKETEVFEACISWAKRVCSRKSINSDKLENLRTELGDIVYEIRFLSMTFEEFTNLHSSNQGFLTPDETMEIMYMLGNMKHFNTRKFSRNLRNEEVLEINRIVHKRRTLKHTEMIMPVTFTCNKAIRLKGFATGFKFDEKQSELQITITGHDENLKVHRPKYAINNYYRETTVHLDETIDVGENDRVEVNLLMQQSPSISTQYILDEAKDLDDFNFAFNVKDSPAQGILLTKLFFFRKR